VAEFYATLKSFLELVKLFQSAWVFYKANQKELWFQNSVTTFNELTKPDATVEQKKKAISDLAKLWGSV